MNTGFLYIHKPAGMTSFGVIARLRKITDVKRIGHAGTLDPFATGLLIVAVGRESTRELDKFLKKDKTYRATMKLGYESTTGDPEGEKTEVDLKLKPSKKEVTEVIKKFVGEIEQTPPQHSAIKIGGMAAYKYARRGEKVEIKPRKIKIHSLKVKRYEYPELEIEVEVSSGTYIRTLAEDIGKELKTGAYLTQLERTSIDEIRLRDSQTLEELNKDNWPGYLHQITNS